jgi:apolipoprotein N-acyltransferase
MASSRIDYEQHDPLLSDYPRLAVFLAGKRGDWLSLIAGAVLPLAFAPFDFFPAAIVAPALLFLLWLDTSRRRALRRGFLFGIGMFGVGVNWVFVSMYEYGGVGLALSLFLTTLLVAFLALFPAVLGYVLARLFPYPGAQASLWRLAAVFPAGWVMFEWIRGWFLTGFPWLNLGYSQLASPLAGVAPLAGVYGVSLAAALSAGWLVLFILAGNRRLRIAWGAALLGLWAGAAVLHVVSWTQPVGAPLRVTLLQGDIPQELKWLWNMREPSIELYAKLTRKHWDSRLIVWPESALPEMYDQAKDFLDGMEKEAREHGSDLLIGVLYEDPATGRYYNSMVSVGGSRREFYYKHHLVPFTEYLPMKSLLGGIVDFMRVPMSDFSAGPAVQPPLAVAGQRAGISICYEDAFGEEVIRELPAATLLVNVSNDAWFGHSIAPQQHLQIARMRAAETGRPLLRATNTGMTAIVDAKGRVQEEAPQFEVAALSGEVQPMQGATVYVRLGNYPVVILMVGMLVIPWLMLRRRNPR